MSSDSLDDVRNDHHQFDKGELTDHVGDEPIALFKSWLEEAKSASVSEANAMAISTLDQNDSPKSRIVYFRELWEGGLVFYTNYLSAKGKALNVHPKAHALFFWPTLERQISISGRVTRVPAAMSDAYFASRPRSSQLGAWASAQSEPLDSRSTLEERLIALDKQYPNEVPRPPHWGGFVLFPSEIEFWQGRPSRLHDRIVFEQLNGGWNIYRRNP